jgi:hypothetical protein
LQEVARFVRWEYGPRTSVDYLLAELEAAPSAAPPGARRTLREAVRAVARGVRSFLNGHAASETTASKTTD